MLHHAEVRNYLLQGLSGPDFQLLQPHLRLISTKLRQTLIQPHQPITQLFFPEVGYVSVTAGANSKGIEVGMIGREGLVGASPVLLESDITPFHEFVQCPGEVLAIDTTGFRAAIEHSSTLKRLTLRYLQTRLLQAQQTAYANTIHNVRVRLALWLLMCHDRLDSDEIPITHEALSLALGVRRAGITTAIQVLEGNCLIKAQRGRLTIQNRQGLIALADGRYGIAEAEYTRLMRDS